MASSDQLKALIKSHISRDDGHFYSVAMQVAAHEAKLGHGKLAEDMNLPRASLGRSGAATMLAGWGPAWLVPLRLAKSIPECL